MKTFSWMLLLAFSLPLLAGPRNIFIAPSSPCEALLKRLDGWRLHGVLYQPPESVALMTFSGRQWRRIREGLWIEPQARVTTLFEQQVTVSLKGACEGGYYHWNIQGVKNDQTYRGRHNDAGAVSGGGE